MINMTMATWLVSGAALAFLIGARTEFSMTASFAVLAVAIVSFCLFLVVRYQPVR
jgi:hypothetical protein